MIPAKFAGYFWDTEIGKIDLKNHRDYVIERVLEYGSVEAWKWLKKQYTEEEIVQVLKTSRRISLRSGKFFARYYKLDPQELLCIRKPFTNKQDRF